MRVETTHHGVRRMDRIRTLVADDEPLARDLLCSLVKRDGELELVGAAASGSEALRLVESCAPELLLLDIQMPNLDGISVAEQLSTKEVRPYTIFVTAHDSFALQAFEFSVRDYLVKPVSKQRFAAAIRRAKQQIGRFTAERQEPLVVRSGEMLVSLMPEDIVWVEAANQYVRLHTVNSGGHLISQSLRQFSSALSAKAFTRIHRSTLINTNHLTAVLSIEGQHRAQMSDGTTHNIARNRKSLLPDLLAHVRENTRL